MIAPEESVTVPVMVAKVVCAQRKRGARPRTAKARRMDGGMRGFMGTSSKQSTELSRLAQHEVGLVREIVRETRIERSIPGAGELEEVEQRIGRIRVGARDRGAIAA